jgi:hypothetical protein
MNRVEASVVESTRDEASFFSAHATPPVQLACGISNSMGLFTFVSQISRMHVIPIFTRRDCESEYVQGTIR